MQEGFLQRSWLISKPNIPSYAALHTLLHMCTGCCPLFSPRLSLGLFLELTEADWVMIHICVTFIYDEEMGVGL